MLPETLNDDWLELDTFLNGYEKAMKSRVYPRTPKKKVIVISGPTAVGKTSISIKVAKILGGEIISADSVQVYRKMDIGTAKATPEEMAGIPHHLIDSRDLIEPFNVAHFYEETKQIIQEVIDRGNVPIVVGGTGFYINTLLYGPPMGPQSKPEVRLRLQNQMERLGPEAMYQRLRELDPNYAMTVTPNDQQKIIRALEIIEISGKKVSSFPKRTKGLSEKYNFRCWFLHMPREHLNTEIEKRCDKMLADGLIDEVAALKEAGIEHNPSASNAIGYRQCLEFLNSSQTPEEYNKMSQAFKKASKGYAKRQITWFNNKDRDNLFLKLNVMGAKRADIAQYIINDFEFSL